jgi:hypothetical protein
MKLALVILYSALVLPTSGQPAAHGAGDPARAESATATKIGADFEDLSIADLTPVPVPNTPPEEVHITVRGLPTFRHEDVLSYLVLPTVDGRQVEVPFTPEHEPKWMKVMPRERVLDFTLWQDKRVLARYESGREDCYWQSSVETIKDGAQTLYDARICSRHSVQMQRALVRISYGLPMPGFLEAMKKDFPGGPGFVLGGCCVESEAQAWGYRCSECVAAYNHWEAQEALAERSKNSRPNKSPEATTSACTPAADAPVAPAIGRASS